jgi:hypothetical protein
MIWTLYHFEFGDHCDLDRAFGLQITICYACITLEIILTDKIINIQRIPCQFFQNAILKNSVLLAR